MPKQELDGEGVFNLALAIVGLVLDEGSLEISELAEHFDVSEKAIVKVVRTIANSEDVARYETHFYVDEELLEEGLVSFKVGQGNLDQVPTLSRYQQSSLAMGLEFLASLPEFAANKNLAELRQVFSASAATKVVSRNNLDLEKLELLRASVLERFRVEFDYLSQVGKRTSRQVDPLRIDLVGNKHYLRGYCLEAQELRAFRVDRISNLNTTSISISSDAQASEIPEEIYGHGEGHLVEISADAQASEIFWNFPVSGSTERKDGKVIGKIKVGNLDSIARHIVRYGGAVEVLAPQEARDAVRKFAELALNGYKMGEE